MNNNSYIFFNKEGYPHNFQYNKETEGWEGKIIFDENSDQTFKTQSLHIFESVEPIEFSINSDFIKLEYFNNSGLTFTGEVSYNNELITNIIKVNESDEFYTKWIFGNRFDKKFPKGTIVYFSGITNSDFSEDQYFAVLDVKKNAILVKTNTNNNIFDFTYIPSGYTSSLNVISINDYNRNLYNEDFFQNLYINKNFSIINSNYNNSIVSVKNSGISYSYINELKLTGNKNDIFTTKIQLFTERPNIFHGNILLSGNTMETLLNVGKFAKLLAPEVIYNSDGTSGLTKKEIIFQDIIGNQLFSGSSFTVENLITTNNIGLKELFFKKYYNTTNNFNSSLSNTTEWNTIQFYGTSNLIKGDIITLNGITSNLNNNRYFYISNISYNSTSGITILFTPDYIIEETGVTYNITKNLQPHQITTAIVTPTGYVSEFYNTLIYDAYCYSTSNILNYSQTYISGSTNSMYKNTIDAYINKYKFSLYEYGIDVYYSSKDDGEYLTLESLYGSKNSYFYVSGYTNGIKINDNFTLSDSGITEKFDIITNETLQNEYTNRVSDKLYKNQIPSEIVLYLNNDNNRFGFKLSLNGNEYFINYSGNTQQTINNFINYYDSIMYSNGFNINSGYSYEYSGYTLNIISDIDIWELKITVNILSSYIISKSDRNNAILLSGNEIRTNYNLFNLELATGMIIKVSGSSYNVNNKEYNIIQLSENIIGLSYQGTMISESSINILCKTREFLRKPRGEYEKDIYLRVYWETPYTDDIDESIFIYDVSGAQLIPYNNILNLEYKGVKPLIDSLENNVVTLNKTPNKDINQIYNPKVQQTIFNELYFKLEQLDSSDAYNWIPEPLEIYLGYNSPNEGVNNRTLKIEKIEKNENSNNHFVYSGYTNSGTSISTDNFIFSGDTITYTAPVDFSFISYGFKKNHLIKAYFKDQSKYNQRIFENVNTYKIKDVSRNKIIIDTGYTYIHQGVETGYTSNSSGFTFFTSTGTTFFYKIEVQPKEVLSCIIYGQTEIEDIRFKVNLNNVGVKSEDDIYQILYASDIQDNAVDYTLFNRKRKEMLSNFREIYDYIGSYKSLVNAINYFGYNDLLLYEYYRKKDKASNYSEIYHKVLIPDIFDNTVEGWNEMDFISGKFQNRTEWGKTNLFNLSYRITDEEGNNVLIYTLNEVIYKLTNLKKWLRQNIIPISANLVDITGLSETTKTLYNDYDESSQTKKSVIERKSTVVNFNYTATLNFENNYLISVNFYTLSGNTNNTTKNYNGDDINSFTTLDNSYSNSGNSVYNFNEPVNFTVKIKTFYLSACTNSYIAYDTGYTYNYQKDDTSETELVPVQYFKINKNDLKPFSFNINKYVDPYIYIETTTYDNDGCGIGYVNNKMYYFDEPRNHWLVTHNFDMRKMKYWQHDQYINNTPQ